MRYVDFASGHRWSGTLTPIFSINPAPILMPVPFFYHPRLRRKFFTIFLLFVANSHVYVASYANKKMKTKTTWRKSSFHLGLLKPSSSGAYCGQTFDQNHQIIIIMRWLVKTHRLRPSGRRSPLFRFLNHPHNITFRKSLFGACETLQFRRYLVPKFVRYLY